MAIERIDYLPNIPEELRIVAKSGRLIPFIGAGASRIANCPSWDGFADGLLDQLVHRDTLNHSQAQQIRDHGLPPRMKLSFVRNIAKQASVDLDYETIIHPKRDRNHADGRRLYRALGRLHEDDLAGHVQQLEPWRVVALPAMALGPEEHVIESPFGCWIHRRKEGEALHSEREPLEDLERYRRAQGEEIFSAQFLQAPVAPGGNIVKIDQFQRFDLQSPPVFERIILSWDTASKATELSDYSVCSCWGISAKKIYLLNVVRARLEYPDLRTMAIQLARSAVHSHKPEVVLVEDKGSGQSLIDDLKRAGIFTVKAVKSEADKVTRMNSQTALIANGAVFIPREAPWLGDLLQELIGFPLGRHDDQVDSLSQALKWFAANGDGPGLLEYYRGLVRAQTHTAEDDEIVHLKCSEIGTNLVLPINDSPILADANGVFCMPMRHARPLLRSPKWTRVYRPIGKQGSEN